MRALYETSWDGWGAMQPRMARNACAIDKPTAGPGLSAHVCASVQGLRTHVCASKTEAAQGVWALHAHLVEEGWSAVCRILARLSLALTLPFFTGLLPSASVVQRLCKPLATVVLLAAVSDWFGRAARLRPLLNRPARLEVEGWVLALLLIVLDLLLTGDDGVPSIAVALLAVLLA